MNILQLEIVNNKKIKCFKVNLNGKNLEVSGSTGTGKTTAISALWEIMEKKQDSLSHGEKSGHIKIKIGDSNKWIIATRKQTSKTSTISITDSSGENISQALFKQMLSSLAVNPHKIMEMKPKEQVQTLLRAAKLDIDLQKINKDIIESEEKRLELYRRVELLNPGDEPEKVEAVKLSDLLAQRDEAVAVNESNRTKRGDLTELKSTKLSYEEEIKSIKAELERLQLQLATKEDELVKVNEYGKQLAAEVKSLQDVDLGPINTQIHSAETINEKALAYKVWVEKNTKHEKAALEHSEMDTRVKELNKIRKTALDNATWPIDGLTIQDGNILYNNILVENLGNSEQMLVCAALAMEDILKHPIRVVRMDGIESMSKDDFEKLKKLFNDKNIQVLSTRVSREDTEPNEIVIIDGEYMDEESKAESIEEVETKKKVTKNTKLTSTEDISEGW